MRQSFIFSFVFFMGSLFAYAQNPFISVWFTNPENEYKLTVNLYGSYSYYWEDADDPTIYGSGTGSNELSISVPNSNSYYRLKLTPQGATPLDRIAIKHDDSYISRVEQWGDVQWSSFEEAFQRRGFLFTGTDTPDLSNVTNMHRAFYLAGFLDIHNFNDWDVSHIEDMSEVFGGFFEFNLPIGNWDVSNVKNMSGMFYSVTEFNQPIGNWDTGSVTDMSEMFKGAHKFNQPIGNWDVSNVENMSGMFQLAKNFNQPIGNWDTGNVTTMSSMFSEADSFNQPIGNWDVSKVKYMSYMFYGNLVFNQPIGDWNTSSVEWMNGMFMGTHKFNQPIGEWDTSSVIVMSDMFFGAYTFNQPVGNWDVRWVEDMSSMFYYADTFNQSVEDWNVSNLVVADLMFYGSIIDQNLGKWNLRKIYTLTLSPNTSCENYSLSLKGWALNPNVNSPNVFITAEGLEYSPAAAPYRDYLINEKGWTFHYDTEGDCELSSSEAFLPEISIYPNPASDFIRMSGVSGKAEIQITDLSGRQLSNIRLDSANEMISIKNLEKGVYILQITLENGEKISKKVVKK